jgi:copper chaperone
MKTARLNEGDPMNRPMPTELPLVDGSGGCCGGNGCGCGGSTANEQTTPTHEKRNLMPEQNVQSFAVTGMTCGHCASAVTDEIQQLPGVSEVAVDLVAGGTSTVRVTANEPLGETLVATALEEAGDYRLA